GPRSPTARWVLTCDRRQDDPSPQVTKSCRKHSKLSRLVNNLVGTGEECRRDGKAERSRGIEIDDQPEFTGRLDWQISRTRALEDLVDVTCRAAEQVAVIGGERDQSPFDGKDAEGVDHGQPSVRGECNNPGPLDGAQRA